MPEHDVVQHLRGMVAALGRRRHAAERTSSSSSNSWHVLLLPLIRRAFPGVPWIFIYREPVEVLASLAQSRPRQMFPNGIKPSLLTSQFSELEGLSLDALSAHVLGRYCRAAIEHLGDGGGLLVEDRELPDGAFSRVLDHFGLRYHEHEFAAMRAAAAFDAKNPGIRFHGDAASKRSRASEEIRQLVERELNDLHSRLDALRLAGLSAESGG